MDDAWQNQQDIAPSNGALDSGTAGDDSYGASQGAGSPRERDIPPPRRSSRSRSPGQRNDRGRGGGDRGDPGQVNPGNNLHVSGLSNKVDTRELETAFAKIGRVQKAQVMYDPHSRDSRGFGFVTMETAEEADAAITALNATELHGKVMNVERARRGRARTPTPGKYYGPPKRDDYRGGGGYDRPRYDDRGHGGRDERRPRYDDYDRRPRYDDHRGGGRDYDRGGYGGRGGGYDDRRGGGGYDDRRGGGGYDDRRY